VWGTARGSGSPSAALVVEVAVCGRVEDEVRLVLVAGRVSSRRRTGATGIRSKGPIRRRLWFRRCAGAVTSSVGGLVAPSYSILGLLAAQVRSKHVRRGAVGRARSSLATLILERLGATTTAVTIATATRPRPGPSSRLRCHPRSPRGRTPATPQAAATGSPCPTPHVDECAVQDPPPRVCRAGLTR